MAKRWMIAGLLLLWTKYRGKARALFHRAFGGDPSSKEAGELTYQERRRLREIRRRHDDPPSSPPADEHGKG